VPSFDLTWLNINDANGEAVVLIPGGGGSTKSGVRNQIQIGRLIGTKKGGFELLKSFETDVDDKSVLCSGITVGTVLGHKIICAFLDNQCAILNVSTDENIELKRVTEFKANFSEDGSVNCAAVLPSGHIVTGGDDGVCRLWAVTINKSHIWQVKKLTELHGHTAPIMDISYHPKDALISTSSKDGFCKIWNVVSGKMVCDVPSVPGLPGTGGTGKNKQAQSAVKMECRGCNFSSDGNYLFSIQSARRGSTHLIEWELNQFDEIDEDGGEVKGALGSKEEVLRTALSVSVSRTREISKVPSTRLKLSEEGTYIAVGASDGSVTVVEVEGFQTVSKATCHDLPVTGLGFAPESTAMRAGLQAIIVTCSADNRMAMIKIDRGLSPFTKVIFIVLSLLCIAALLFFSLVFFAFESAPEMITQIFKDQKDL